AARHRRVRDREIVAVAGAHADRLKGARRQTVAAGSNNGAAARAAASAAEQFVEEARGSGLVGGGGVLRAAIVLRQLPDQRAALAVLAAGAALELLEIGGGAVEIAAHLLDLRVERAALRHQAGEQRQKPLALAALLVRLRQRAVEVGLLLGHGVFGALDLVGAGRIGRATIDGGELAFQPHAGRVRRRLVRRALGGRGSGQRHHAERGVAKAAE